MPRRPTGRPKKRRKLSAVLNVPMFPDRLEELRGEAERLGHTSVAALARVYIDRGLSSQTDK